MIVVNFVVSHSVGIKGTCSPSSHFFMCRPNSSSCGLSFRVAAGGVRVGPRVAPRDGVHGGLRHGVDLDANEPSPAAWSRAVCGNRPPVQTGLTLASS